MFHILIITLQAFIFMMLTLVYLGQAHDATELRGFLALSSFVSFFSQLTFIS